MTLRYKYQLSSLPLEVADAFRRLAVRCEEEEISVIDKQLRTALARIDCLNTESHAANINLAEKLKEASFYLIEHYDEYSHEEQDLIIGAIRYFATYNDPTPDNTPVVGLNDDVKIMNYALERLGLNSLLIE